MVSGFRAPADEEWLVPFFAKFKVAVRLITLLALSSALLWSWANHQQRVVQTAKLLLPLGLLCFYALLSTIWSPLKPETFGQAGSLTTLLLLAFAVSILVQKPNEIGRIIGALTALTVSICFLLLVTAILIPNTGHLSRDGEGLGHSTSSGATASLGVVLLFLSAMLRSWRWPQLLIIPGMLILLPVMLISANRLSMAITAILFGIAVCRFANRQLIASLLIVIGVSGTLFLVVDPDFGSIRQSLDYLSRDQSSEEIGSLSGRSSMWEAMWESFNESPVLGHGYFVTSSTGELYVWYASKNWTAHNVVLQALVTTGVVGTMLLLIGLTVPIIALMFAKRQSESTRALKWFLGIMFTWYFFWGTLNESFLGPTQPESVIFFMIFGILVGAAVSGNAGDHRRFSILAG